MTRMNVKHLQDDCNERCKQDTPFLHFHLPPLRASYIGRDWQRKDPYRLTVRLSITNEAALQLRNMINQSNMIKATVYINM